MLFHCSGQPGEHFWKLLKLLCPSPQTTPHFQGPKSPHPTRLALYKGTRDCGVQISFKQMISETKGLLLCPRTA